jgi:hypothetical protein
MMRRVSHIVNEMEFRMLREAKSFSPSTSAEAMKRFFAAATAVDWRPDRTSASSPGTSHARACRLLASAHSMKRPWPAARAIRSAISLTGCHAIMDLIVSL